MSAPRAFTRAASIWCAKEGGCDEDSISHSGAAVTRCALTITSPALSTYPPPNTSALASNKHFSIARPATTTTSHHASDMTNSPTIVTSAGPVSQDVETTCAHIEIGATELPSSAQFARPQLVSPSPLSHCLEPNLRTGRPPPLALSQGKRTSDQSIGAGELGGLLSPSKKPRIYSNLSEGPTSVPLQGSFPTNQSPVLSRSDCRSVGPFHHPQPPVPSPLSSPSIPRIVAPLLGPEQVLNAGRQSFSLGPHGPGTKRMSTLNAPPGFAAQSEAVAAAHAAAAAGAIFTKVEDVTTNRLPKGTVNSASPARSSSTPGSWSSIDNSLSSKSPDSRIQHPASQLFQEVGIFELLEQDARPTFVVDLLNPVSSSVGTPLIIIYANPALRNCEGLLEVMTQEPVGIDKVSQLCNFVSWAITKPTSSQESVSSVGNTSYDFFGLQWLASTIRNRFRVIYGHKIERVEQKSPSVESRQTVIPITDDIPETAILDSLSSNDNLHPEFVTLPEVNPEVPLVGSLCDEPGYFPDNIAVMPSTLSNQSLTAEDLIRMSTVPKTSFDWTKVPVTDDMPSHFKFARNVDWASTALGPIENWDDDLRLMSNMIMASPHPAAMYWGPEYVAIYNEAYVLLAGEKHPSLMGKRYQEAWHEIWEEINPIFEEACRSGLATMKHEDRLFIQRHGFLEEAWFSWSIVPIVGADGSIVGLYNPAFEDTRRKITQRRMLTLREIGVQTGTARDLKTFWSRVCKGLVSNELDVPFAIVYSVNEENGSEVSSIKSSHGMHLPKITLEQTIGVPENHPSAVRYLDLSTSEDGFAPFMKNSLTAGAPIALKASDGTLPNHLVEGITWKGYGEPSHTIVVFPVHPTTSESIVGFVVFGTNPRRPFNTDFELFVHLLSRQLDTATASIILFEEEIKREQRAARMAALDRQELQKLLHIRTQEAEESEYKFTRMAAFAPVGMFIADAGGDISYSNDTWSELCQDSRSVNTIHEWMQIVHEVDRAGVEASWQKLLNEKVTIAHEFRFNYTREDNDHRPRDAWGLLNAFPERYDHGPGIKSIFGCITDITQQKWAENVHIQQREEALELKRQQENFIDITSHEMRNPLSAILQSADEISNALAELRGSSENTPAVDRLITGCVEAAGTVSLCAAHQKRIVDDILTLSKMDSKLLLVTPIDVQPVDLVQQVLKMFESELKSNDIDARFELEKSFRDMDIDWVKLDPSRLMQVLINLVTNAIKFTQSCETRRIIISLGASSHNSVGVFSQDYESTEPELQKHPQGHGVSFYPRRKEDGRNLTAEPEWGTGEKVNLHFSVEDTGQGLGESDMKALFQRFSQATPRTHVRYGGSGLGLFISRILTELQGGQIGVTSQPGNGSTFSFYVKSRKSPGPTDLKLAEQAQEVIEKVTAARPEDAPALLASSNTTATTVTSFSTSTSAVVEIPVMSGCTMAKLPPLRSLSTPSRDTTTGDLRRPECLSPPIMSSVAARRESTSILGDKNKPLVVRDILIVEDNLVNQKVLQKQLRNAGHKTQVANHGGEALQAIMRSVFWSGTPLPTPAAPTTPSSRSGRETNPFEGPIPVRSSSGPANSSSNTSTPVGSASGTSPSNINVILMDLEMPVMDGMTCSRKIRELESQGKITTHIPIIAVTAYARPEQIEQAKASGIDDVISKPFRIRELMPKIEENIRRWEQEPKPSE